MPRTDGPMSTPAKISATTPGMPTRSASSAAIFAATSTIRMSRSTAPTSMTSLADLLEQVPARPHGADLEPQ